MPTHDLLTWALLAVASVLVGMAKTGVPGLGILVVPMVFHAIPDGRQAPAVLLPLLCAADIAGVAIYRRHAEPGRLWRLFPWVALGMAAGTAALATLPGSALRITVGVLVLIMAGLHLLRERLTGGTIPQTWQAALAFGLVAGFATTVANAAGPVMNLYLLSSDLAKDQFMGTGAWFFFLVNLLKLPIYAWQGMITGDSLLIDLILLPGILVGAFAGKRIYDRLPQRAFEITVLTLTVVAGLSLLLRR